MIQPVPTLDEIAARPELVQGLPREALTALAVRALTVHAILATAALTAPAPSAPAEERLLSAKDVAVRVGRSVNWIYAHAGELPFTVREPGQRPRFSLRGLEQYIAHRAGADAVTRKGA